MSRETAMKELRRIYYEDIRERAFIVADRVKAGDDLHDAVHKETNGSPWVTSSNYQAMLASDFDAWNEAYDAGVKPPQSATEAAYWVVRADILEAAETLIAERRTEPE